jgi:hypothetical protein
MTQITVDAELRAKFFGLMEPLELCDESGRLLARVLPLHNAPDSGRSSGDPRRVTVDSAFCARLPNLTESFELSDESGRAVAIVSPHYDPSEYENLEPHISEEELDRRRQYKGKTYTTEEVLAYLERL